MLAVDTQLQISVPSAKRDARRDIVVIVRKGTPYAVTYTSGGSGSTRGASTQRYAEEPCRRAEASTHGAKSRA
jgi:hypothetical protein